MFGTYFLHLSLYEEKCYKLLLKRRPHLKTVKRLAKIAAWTEIVEAGLNRVQIAQSTDQST